jgi:hypothetical protein
MYIYSIQYNAIVLNYIPTCIIKDACGTGAFVSSALKGNINPGGLPALVFLISAVISFAIGSSWGYVDDLFLSIAQQLYS